MTINSRTEHATKTVTAYVGLGSNMGDREQYLHQAIRFLHQDADIQVVHASAVYETAPVGPVPQAPFLNMAIKIVTSLAPETLLQRLLQIETKLGRVRLEKWGPRTIDLDLLLYGRRRVQTPHLIVPHPRMWERPFVLIPLSDIIQPGEEPRLDEALKTAGSHMEKDGVKLWKWINWREEFVPFVN